MSQPRCLITGCSFYNIAGGERLHGDLHKIGDTYVFNAVLRDGEAAWEYGIAEVRSGEKALVSLEGSFFERRGVIVVPQDSGCYLTQAALEYIK